MEVRMLMSVILSFELQDLARGVLHLMHHFLKDQNVSLLVSQLFIKLYKYNNLVEMDHFYYNELFFITPYCQYAALETLIFLNKSKIKD